MAGVAGDGDEQATAVILGKVKPGREPEYEEWLRGIIAVSKRQPGHKGITVIRPRDPKAPEFVIVLSFDTAPNLEAWLTSDERQAWLERGRPFMEQLPQEQHTTGMESWFSLPGAPAVRPPPRWKMWLLAWFAIFFLLLGFNAATLRTGFVELALPVRVFVATGFLSAAMTWIAMPWLSRRLAGWLYREEHRSKGAPAPADGSD